MDAEDSRPSTQVSEVEFQSDAGIPLEHAGATTVVVVTWQGAKRIRSCVEAVVAQTAQPHESTRGIPPRILVVDNASTDGTAEELAALVSAHPGRLEVLRLPANRGFAGGLQAALERVDTPWLACLNDDAIPRPHWLSTLERSLVESGPEYAAVASRLESPNSELQSLGTRLTAGGSGADIRELRGEPFGFCGGAALLRTSALREVGGVPAEFFCYYEDLDVSWRLRLAGYRIALAGNAGAGIPGAADDGLSTVVHTHGASSELGSRQFHRWNERNRLLTLLRCAPATVACVQLGRFAALTLVLGLRLLRDQFRPWRAQSARQRPANLRPGLRVRVLREFLRHAPRALRARWRIGRRARLHRQVVWQQWRGRGS